MRGIHSDRVTAGSQTERGRGVRGEGRSQSGVGMGGLTPSSDDEGAHTDGEAHARTLEGGT